MTILYIYLAGIILIPIIFLIPNAFFKWITREAVEDAIDYDSGEFIMFLLMALVMWPLFLLIAIFYGIFWIFSKSIIYLFPKHN